MNHISVKFYLIFFSTTLFVFCYGVRFASEQERVANWHQHNTVSFSVPLILLSLHSGHQNGSMRVQAIEP
jgi:hypothetical protein